MDEKRRKPKERILLRQKVKYLQRKIKKQHLKTNNNRQESMDEKRKEPKDKTFVRE